MPDFHQIENSFEADGEKATISKHGMVATSSKPASIVGSEILRMGGNAIDAAVASALAIGISEPQSSGLGGQTLMLVNFQNQVFAIDGSSRAPLHPDISGLKYFGREFGHTATTIPSTLKTLAFTHRKFGKLPWKEVVMPAAFLAKEGTEITKLQSWLQNRELDNFFKPKSTIAADFFLKNGEAYKPGDIFRQTIVSDTLKLIAENDADVFYKGIIAHEIDEDMKAHGGYLTYKDLSQFPDPTVRKPLCFNFMGTTVYTLPPPAFGATLGLAMINFQHLFLQNRNKNLGLIIAESLQNAFSISFERIYQFPDKLEELTQCYSRCTDPGELNEFSFKNSDLIEKNSETTHLSVIDQWDNAVSLTQSIESVYGCKAVTKSLGFLYNNYLLDYQKADPDSAFFLRPGAIPRTNVTPSFLFKDKKLWLAIGSPGSERIVTALLNIFARIFAENMSIDRALAHKRIHAYNRMVVSEDGFNPDELKLLSKMGYKIEQRDDAWFYLGCVQAVMKTSDGRFLGAADHRRDGAAIGI